MHAWLSWIWRTGTEALKRLASDEAFERLGDFTATRRVLVLSGIALVIGIVSAFVALALLKLIGLFTNLFFFQRLDTSLGRCRP